MDNNYNNGQQDGNQENVGVSGQNEIYSGGPEPTEEITGYIDGPAPSAPQGGYQNVPNQYGQQGGYQGTPNQYGQQGGYQGVPNQYGQQGGYQGAPNPYGQQNGYQGPPNPNQYGPQNGYPGAPNPNYYGPQNPYQNQGGYVQPPYGVPQNEGSAGMAVASMVLGLLAIILSCCLYPVAFLLALIGLILGAVAIKKDTPGKGMAIAGLVLSLISIAIAVLFIVLVASAGSASIFDYIENSAIFIK